MSWLELLRTGTKLALLNCPISIASYQKGQAWAKLHLLVEGQEVLCGITSDPLGQLKKGFHRSSIITLHPYCNYLLGLVFCFPIL
jgi:hypothetical protein